MLNTTLFKLYKTPVLLVVLSVFFYVGFAYDLVRTNTVKLVTLYFGLFLLFYLLMRLTKDNTKFMTWAAFIFRAVFIFSIPNLSQDFYRFIWDGRMILEGFNPYLFTPESFISEGVFPIAQAQELYDGMWLLNGSHYTNYPPLKQLCFLISGLFAGESILGSVIVMRIIIIIADFGTLYFGTKLLKKLQLPTHHIFWYILNPFIIIELTGNLHFEGVMIFFLIWSLYLLHSGKWKIAAVVFACSVSVKLIPLLFLPLFYQWFTVSKKNETQNNRWLRFTRNGFINLSSFYCIIGFTTLLLFAPFFSSEFIHNYTKTVGLWFQSFEFNASLYYIARAIGYSISGYNEIASIGKTIPIIVIVFVLAISVFRKNATSSQLITAMLFALSFYYFTATTVHPWYVATLLILSVFSNYKFPLVWSCVIVLSYLAYTNINNTENLWIIALEYLIVYSVFIWEVFIKKANSKELAL